MGFKQIQLFKRRLHDHQVQYAWEVNVCRTDRLGLWLHNGQKVNRRSCSIKVTNLLPMIMKRQRCWTGKIACLYYSRGIMYMVVKGGESHHVNTRESKRRETFCPNPSV
jgi:hypothetical protein